MTEPTAEQVEAERELVHSLGANLCGFESWPLPDTHTIGCERTATALARVRIETLEACEKVASDIAEREEEKQGYYGPAAATGDEIADAIRALRGRT